MPTMNWMKRRPLANERGAINWVVTVTILVVAAGVYLAYAYLPHWMANRKVVSAMREAAYQAWRVRDDDQLRRMILERTDRLVRVEDVSGEVPLIDEAMIRIDRSEDEIAIELSYEVPMVLPGLDEVRYIAFDNAIRADLHSPLAD